MPSQKKQRNGAIEQDADMVMFIYRPKYYGLTEDENGQDMRGRAEIIIAKNCEKKRH